MTSFHRPVSLRVILAAALIAAVPSVVTAQIQVNSSAPVTENFNTLAASGSSSSLPAGWLFGETGTNANSVYTAGTGSNNAGDTYSFGVGGSTERAFGGLLSGSLVPTIGAAFRNETGSAVTSVAISYTGEQWRLGTALRADRLDFQYSTTATGLTAGSWVDADCLDFSSPSTTGSTGAKDGNAGAYRTAISCTLRGLNLGVGEVLWIRWSDFNASGADDGLAVDDFSIQFAGTVPSIGAATPANVSPGELTLLTVTVPPNAGVVSSVAVDLSSFGANAAQPMSDAGTGGDVMPNDRVFSWAFTTPASATPGLRTLTATVNAGGGVAYADIRLTVDPPLVRINQIQGEGSRSSLEGQVVTTRGVITRSIYNGFFIQSTPADDDGNPATSEGLFIFTNAKPSVTSGTLVRVVGTVDEYSPSADLASPPLTELTAPTVTVVEQGWTIPSPVLLTSAVVSPTSLAAMERFEGMLVHVPALTVVAPTSGNVFEASATSKSDGAFYGVLEDVHRPFREAGIALSDPLPVSTPCCVPRFDENPERLRVDTDAQTGPPVDVASGARVTNLTGPLHFSYRTWTIFPDPGTFAVSGTREAQAVPLPGETEFTVASYNMERFFDATPSGAKELVLTEVAFANRLNKASLAIRNVLRMPDILGVQEVENLATLEALAAKVNADASAEGQPNPNYVAKLVEGNDPGGIDVGFLVKGEPRVTVIDVTQHGKDTLYSYTEAGSGDPKTDLLNDRPPLVLRAKIKGPVGLPFPVTVIVNHLRSLNGVEDPVDSRVRVKRARQAEFLAALIQEAQLRGERVVSVGDYNAFAVNDGYVDVIGTLKGSPAPSDEVVQATVSPITPALTSLVDLLPKEEAYSYVFGGNTQTLDHVLVNALLMKRYSRFHYARNNADFPESLRNEWNRPERLSDHDMPVAYFNFPGAPTLALNGLNPMTVELGSVFTDPGAEGSDPDWGALSVVVTGSVDTSRTGSYILTYTVSNGFVSTTLTRTVNVVDTTAPTITGVSATPGVLWPPTGKMVPVSIAVSATDLGGVPACRLTGIASSEGSLTVGSGQTPVDWEILGDAAALLRAERSGRGSGRIYTLSVACTDPSGNAASSGTTVVVPHDNGKGGRK